ncbi:MAG TPA: dihydroorotate dehydrogenase (quinone) [Flavobacteriales bacterium]|jgi:dihydroorotate dehydrogenase|nr:dihydroorotate dehydrogenase (quinone) [Flavobacteriales bacterium]
MYKSIIRPLLFRMNPELAHNFTVSLLNIASIIPGVKSLLDVLYNYKNKSLEREVFGIKFPNPVGLAAGFDKNGEVYKVLKHLGFGFVEVGTVTPKAQSGNPKPRMFRIPSENGLINRMGFNNDGVDALVKNLKNRPKNLIVAGNIGKNKVTPNDHAIEDYLYCFRALHDYVDFFVVNVSSPNTPGLRELQDKGPLMEILNALKKENEIHKDPKPILLKIAPDLTNDQLDDIIDIVTQTKIAGVIATNTTISRKKLLDSISHRNETGGLSGDPLRDRSTEVVKYLSLNSKKSFPIIAVGGIRTAQDAIEKLNAGASLVQVYTGFIYEGPAAVSRINKGLVNEGI